MCGGSDDGEDRMNLFYSDDRGRIHCQSLEESISYDGQELCLEAFGIIDIGCRLCSESPGQIFEVFKEGFWG